MDPRMTEGADLLETFLEDLRTVIHSKLKRATVPPPAAAPVLQQTDTAPNENVGHRRLYVMYDPRDSEAAAGLVDHLFSEFEVLQPIFEGDEAEIREYHDENLRTCDGVLIFYGSTNECWVRRKIREVQKAPGYGRTKAAPVVGIVVAAPRTPEKDRFRTHDAMVLPQLEGLSPDALQQFVASLKR
jgi:hypothetical protein